MLAISNNSPKKRYLRSRLIILFSLVAVLAVCFVLTGGLDAVIGIKGGSEVAEPKTEQFSESAQNTAEADAVSASASAVANASAPGIATSAATVETPRVSQAEEAEPPQEKADALPLAGAVIGIDAGHQLYGNNSEEAVAPGSDTKKPKVTSGTSGTATGIPEHELNLAVALKLQKLLEKSGAKVIMSRTTADVDISNQERASMMNEAGADLVIRIHANGGGASEKGAMMLVPDGIVPKDIENESREAGEIIFASYLSETGAADLGVIPRSDMTGFNWSEVPVCLIEMGFMTNSKEDKLLATDKYRNKCARGLANGIEEWYLGRGV